MRPFGGGFRAIRDKIADSICCKYLRLKVKT